MDEKSQKPKKISSGTFVDRLVIRMTTGWYAVMLMLGMLFAWVCCKSISFMPCLSPDTKRKWCIIITIIFFRIPIWLCPWIQIKNLTPTSEWLKLCDQVNGRRALVLVNHTSYMDAFLFVYCIPLSVIVNFRTLLKAQLTKLPLFGVISDMCGHLPVYYNSEKVGDFSVDRAAQSKVNATLKEWFSSGGGVVLYPEGQVAKDPSQLQSFRRGAFKYHLDYKLPLWGVIVTGLNKSWPKGVAIGGRPATIEVKLVKIPEKAELTDAAAVSTDAQSFMQSVLDDMLKKEK